MSPKQLYSSRRIESSSTIKALAISTQRHVVNECQNSTIGWETFAFGLRGKSP